MRPLILALLFLVSRPVFAAEYFVDATHGDDANSGESPATAWKSVGRVNRASLLPGSAVLFKRGASWHEQLTIPSSGETGKPIRFGAYGRGPKPALDLTEPVSGWRLHSGQIWVADVGPEVLQVFLDGAYLPIAHFPNNTFLTATENSTGNDYLVDDHLPPVDLIGADLRIWARDWTVEESRILATTGSRIKFEASSTKWSNWPVQAKNKYVVANKLWMLDAPGEWCWEKGRLYLWLPDGGSPSGKDIRATGIRYGIYAQGRRQIIIEDLAIIGPAADGVRLNDTTEFTVRRTDITHAGTLRYLDYDEDSGKGIAVSRTQPLDIESGIIAENTIHGAIHVGISVYQLGNVTITGNDIAQVGTTGWADNLPEAGTGIRVVYSTPNCVIRRNTVRDVSWTGIYFNWNNNLVEENIVQRVMTRLTDGAGIYCDGAHTHGGIIRHNILTDVRDTKAFGVYLDEKAESVTVEGNTIAHFPRGTMNHNSRNNVFQSNTVYDVLRDAVTIQEDTNAPKLGYSAGNLYRGNIFFSKSSGPLVNVSNWAGDFFDFASFRDNVFSSRSPSALVTKAGKTFPRTSYTLEAWPDLDHEAGSRFLAQSSSAEPGGDPILFINEHASVQSYAYSGCATGGRDYEDVHGRPVTWPVKLDGFSSVILIPTAKRSLP